MASDAKWWRVEVTRSGKVLDVREASEAPPENIPLVLFLEASNAAAAALKAERLYARRKVSETRRRLDAEGRCRCGAERDRPGRKTCSRCALRSSNYDKGKVLSKRDGEHVPRQRDEGKRVETLKQTKRDATRERRLATLIEVQQRFHRMSPGAFKVWLAKEVRDLSQSAGVTPPPGKPEPSPDRVRYPSVIEVLQALRRAPLVVTRYNDLGNGVASGSTIDRLEKLGYAERQRRGGPGSSIVAVITSKGRAQLRPRVAS